MKKEFGKYYLGLDIGTDSVGWAVTDDRYEILEFNRKAMWGIHLFESGKTAEDRRIHRCSRRRLERRNQRVSLLRELFGEEIYRADQSFFERLDESRLHSEDRKVRQKNTLFNDPDFKDPDFHKKYPTAYHLRYDMMNTDTKPDIRLVYLAVHHIIKYRGHFLFAGITDGRIPEFRELFSELVAAVDSETGFDIDAGSCSDVVEGILQDKDLGMTEKKSRLYSVMSLEEPGEKAFADLIVGGKVPLSKLFGDEDLKDVKACFKDADFDESADELEDAVGSERMFVIRLMKQVFDWSVLAGLLGGCDSISRANMVKYDQHQKDLKLLKALVRQLVPDRYDDVFKASELHGNYSSYVKVYGKRTSKSKSCSQDDFCKFMRNLKCGSDANGDVKTFMDVLPEDPASGSLCGIDPDRIADMKRRLNDNTFMPKQTVRDNSVIPFSLHKYELEKILGNVSRFYPFLESKDGSGISVKEKILMLDEFRIPYYVGPLDTRSDRSWVARRSNEEVRPWNFNEVVDADESSQRFIDRLTNFCTYLVGEKVLPKNSLLYSAYELYNELNNIKINGEGISVDLKKQIFNDLFKNVKTVKKVTVKDMEKYLKLAGRFSDSDEITGIDRDVKSNLRSYVQMRNIIGDKVDDRRMSEEIIRIITIFGDDRSRLRKKLISDFSGKLTESEINGLSKLQFNGWGRLSEKLLTGISHRSRESGEAMNIMTALESTNLNLMELLSGDFTYTRQIDEMNRGLTSDSEGRISYKIVEDLYVSPAVKRGIWRTLNIVQDILKVTGHPPAKIFVETTRETRDSSRTVSRKGQLMELFKACVDQEHDWAKEIEGLDEGRLRGKKLFSYYTQHGRCMYCGKNIDLNDLGNNDLYDMDHIYPQSKTTDDSIHNNMVLVCKSCNQSKTDTYPLPAEWQGRMHGFWTHLSDNGFITKEKYSRLVRSSGFGEDELSGFIARQLVETSQSVKAVATALRSVFGSDSDVVYVKGNAVSRFRQDHGMLKCRAVNDLHHAKDAYLNIVVGNVYDTKFTKDPRRFVETGRKYNLNRMYDWDVERDGVSAWKAGEEGTIGTVRRYIRRNNILFTRFATEGRGGFFDENAILKSKGKFPIKKGLDSERYGGYDNEYGAYFVLAEHDKKKKRIRTIESIPIHFAISDSGEPELKAYLENTLGLVNPRIIISKMRIRSTLEINGFRLNITGRSNNRIICICGVQLIVSDRSYDYFRRLSNYMDSRKERKSLVPADFKLSEEENRAAYDELMSKLSRFPYDVFLKTPRETLESKRGEFEKLPLDAQCAIVNEILHMFQCNPLITNLKAIGGPGVTGGILVNKEISLLDSVKIINQSPSGLFERVIDAKI